MASPIGVLPSASNLYGAGNQGYFPGPTVAGANPYQTGGYDQMINATSQMAGYVPGLMNSGMNQLNNLGSWVSGGGAGIDDKFMNWLSPGEINNVQGNFEVNPYVQGVTDAYGDAGQRAFERNVLPSLSANAVQAGGMGGSRHALAQGLATSDFNKQLQETTAGLYGSAWQDAANRQMQSRGQTLSAMGQDRSRATNAALGDARNQISAYGMIPGAVSTAGNLLSQATGLATAPGQTALNAGNFYQNLAQQQLDSAKERWDWSREDPWNRAQQYAGIVQNNPTPQGPVADPGNPWASALQGAATGFDMASSFAPVQNSAQSNPWLGQGQASLGFTPGLDQFQNWYR